MKISKILKDNASQIYAITEKNVKLSLRFKLNLIISFITPLISLIMPFIIMGKFFSLNTEFGPWNRDNFVVFQFIAYHIFLLRTMITIFAAQFIQEKYWYTLQSIIIAPFNRINLLFGIFFSHLILQSIPFIFIFVLCYIFYPISLITFFWILTLDNQIFLLLFCYCFSVTFYPFL